MRRFVLGAALVGLMAVNANAQELPEARAGSFFIGPYAGYMFFGDLWDFAGPTEQSLDDAPMFGAQAGVNLTRSVALLGNLGYAKSAFTLENDATGTSERISGDLGVFFYDAALQFRIPMNSTRISPLAQVGVGGVRYTLDTDDITGEPRSSDVAFNLGLGADIGLARNVALRLMAKDYITSTKWNDIGEVSFDDDAADNTAHNIGLTIGLRIGR
ncbi:MAG TPA: outer membrane beta-barrel protein [Gemmatimonadaceae bacterium]|nr:outer membrane beta-barrel protein [Gemmatimonadaceae bacterium]